MSYNDVTIGVCVTSEFRNWLIYCKQQELSGRSVGVYIESSVL